MKAQSQTLVKNVAKQKALDLLGVKPRTVSREDSIRRAGQTAEEAAAFWFCNWRYSGYAWAAVVVGLVPKAAFRARAASTCCTSSAGVASIDRRRA